MNIQVMDRESGKGLEVLVVEFQSGGVGMQHAPVMTDPDEQVLHVIQAVFEDAGGTVIHRLILADWRTERNVEELK
jgi:hypothetical protein